MFRLYCKSLKKKKVGGDKKKKKNVNKQKIQKWAQLGLSPDPSGSYSRKSFKQLDYTRGKHQTGIQLDETNMTRTKLPESMSKYHFLGRHFLENCTPKLEFCMFLDTSYLTNPSYLSLHFNPPPPLPLNRKAINQRVRYFSTF